LWYRVYLPDGHVYDQETYGQTPDQRMSALRREAGEETS
jgi:hypothetical protein